MAIDLQTISQLREKTGAGLSDCKIALEEAGGDLEKAIEILRKRGEIKAAKKADRATKEGVVALAKEPGRVAGVSLVCETDFAAKNEIFINAAQSLAEKLLTAETEEFKVWSESLIKNELIVKIGENIKLEDFVIIKGEIIGTYVHFNKKVAAVVVLTNGSESLANDLAMQVTAMSPKYLGPADIPVAELEKEREIYREQLKVGGKPEAMIEKIIEGKLAKYYEEVCLLNQFFIKDDSQKIGDLLKLAGAEVSIKEFKKFQV